MLTTLLFIAGLIANAVIIVWSLCAAAAAGDRAMEDYFANKP